MTARAAVDVQGVRGRLRSDGLGMTLFHEHIFVDNRARAPRPPRENAPDQAMWSQEMNPGLMADLRYKPMACEDNCVLNDLTAAIDELNYFTEVGGRTIIEQTPIGAGRKLEPLVRVAEATGLNIIAGTGYYLEVMHPRHLRTVSVGDIAEGMIDDIVNGQDGIKCGLIGEIGISPDFTGAERRVLQGAALAHHATGVPISVHLPGWHRLGHEILDCLESGGVSGSSVVLSHMNPSVTDCKYQLSLAQRGAYLSFDMFGIDWYFGHTGFQAPSDSLVAEGVVALYQAGAGEQILLSGDTFLKMQLRKYGGLGYDHVPLRVLPMLQRIGMSESEAAGLLGTNPGRVFESSAQNAAPASGRTWTS